MQGKDGLLSLWSRTTCTSISSRSYISPAALQQVPPAAAGAGRCPLLRQQAPQYRLQQQQQPDSTGRCIARCFQSCSHTVADHIHTMEEVLKAAAAKDLVNDVCPSIDLIDLDYVGKRIDGIRSAFSESYFLNAAALKANSMRGVLQFVKEKGMGAECASICEVEHAVALGFSPENIVYDSPCKTRHDIKRSLDLNVHLNLDNDYEMTLVDELLKGPCANTKSKIGLRINPCVGGGIIEMISTATKVSKFGLPVMDSTRDKVVGLYEKYSWLTGIHIHVGSQGVPLELFVNGTRVCMDTVALIESRCGRRLDTIDIGGGLSTSYTDPDEPAGFDYSVYRKQLEAKVPELFSGDYRVITEFGRSLFLKSGLTVTRAEHVKQWIPELKPIVLTHVGANQFIREAYLPEQWRHRFSLADPKGRVKVGSEKKLYDLAGPMCFQGDFLARDVELPTVENGDWVIIHDTGAYSMNMYSKYNSILPSAVYGYRRSKAGDVQFVCLKERETPEENLAFWGLHKPRPV